MDCIKFTFLYSCMGMGMWMHHGVGDGYVDAPWSGWWCILALFSLVPPPPPVSTAQSTHTQGHQIPSLCVHLSVRPPLVSDAVWSNVGVINSKVLLVKMF